MERREAWHIISLPGLWGNRISFLSEVKMMHHTGMNNFMVIDIHTLTNRKSYGYVGNGFISGGRKKKKKERGLWFKVLEKWQPMLSTSGFDAELKHIINYRKLLSYIFRSFSKVLILLKHKQCLRWINSTSNQFRTGAAAVHHLTVQWKPRNALLHIDSLRHSFQCLKQVSRTSFSNRGSNRGIPGCCFTTAQGLHLTDESPVMVSPGSQKEIGLNPMPKKLLAASV